MTAVPKGFLNFVSLWPTGQPRPTVSTLNAWDGSVIANAAVVPAGQGGAVSVYASNETDLLIDINGYFAEPAANEGFEFYPVAPCRVADTRNASAGPVFGAPSMLASSERTFPVPASTCSPPSNAAAYAMNVTVLPNGFLNFLTLWPGGQSRPVVSTLNAWDGNVIANAAIVPSGTGGVVNAFTSNTTQLILDLNGYFGPPAFPSGMSYSFVPLAPFRLVDTRQNRLFPFGAPSFVRGESRDIPLQEIFGHGMLSSPAAVSLNVTVIPKGFLNFVSLWPTGQPRPNVSTLNAWDGSPIANAAIVPVATSAKITVYASDATDLIIDVNGFFDWFPYCSPSQFHCEQ
jgi:hypothetical protein